MQRGLEQHSNKGSHTFQGFSGTVFTSWLTACVKWVFSLQQAYWQLQALQSLQ